MNNRFILTVAGLSVLAVILLSLLLGGVQVIPSITAVSFVVVVSMTIRLIRESRRPVRH